MFRFFEAARANLVAAKTAQQDLAAAFDAIGIDFTELHPVIHRAIRNEAIVRGTEAAAAQFVQFASALDEGDGTDEEKATFFRRFIALELTVLTRPGRTQGLPG